MKLDEAWLRAHLPPELADGPLDCFSGEYLDGLTVMAEGERGGPDTVLYRAKDEEDLRFWQLEQICRFLPEKDPPEKKTWRWYRHHAENGQWRYVERRHYDYNAIEDTRLYGFECFLRKLHYGYPQERWEKKVREHISLMNYWYTVAHWDYDREALCFIEISDSKEHDTPGGPDEPQPGSVIRIIDGREQDVKSVTTRSEQDYQYAAEFREGVHKEALERLRKIDDSITEVVDRYGVEDYFEDNWEYPGKWYTYVAVPPAAKGRKNLIDTIVRDTLARRRVGEAREEKRPDAPETPPRREEAPARTADGICPDEPFSALIAQYPDLALDYCIVAAEAHDVQGGEAHRRALEKACRKLFVPDEDGETWRYDVRRARGTRTGAEALFTSNYPETGLNYRRAFLYPPHGNSYSGKDFAKVNAALFPEGTDRLEVYEWTTDWSDYFDEGHEWWGALCLTVYDRQLDRFVVILASATD